MLTSKNKLRCYLTKFAFIKSVAISVVSATSSLNKERIRQFSWNMNAICRSRVILVGRRGSRLKVTIQTNKHFTDTAVYTGESLLIGPGVG